MAYVPDIKQPGYAPAWQNKKADQQHDFQTMDGAESSINFKRKILQRVKDLTNHGKHKEASELFKIYFPNFGEYTNGKS